MKKINIALLDDHKIVTDGIKAIFLGNKDISIIFDASSFEDFKKKILRGTPDVLLLDINLHNIDGTELIPEFNKSYPEMKILVLSGREEEEIICKAVKMGADGFLHKDVSTKELIKAIQSIYDGEPYFGKNIAHVIYKSYNNFMQNVSAKETSISISAREKEIIELLAEGYSSKDIAEKLFISSRTVETHKKNILEKLGLHNTVELLRYAIKHNIVQI